MGYDVRVIADSIADGVRLTTLQVTFPRFILAEFNTHRVLSRNSASSRAIPVERRLLQVRAEPFVPVAFGVNKRGMQADEVLDDRDNDKATDAWLRARDVVVREADALCDIGVHKQHANRLLETFAWHTVVVTATEWENFDRLRAHKAAQPEMQITARMMIDACAASRPRTLKCGEWHLPYIQAQDAIVGQMLGQSIDELIKISVVRCAAVSYERQDADRTFEEVEKRYDEMRAGAHWSPFEHQAVRSSSPTAPPFSPRYKFVEDPSGPERIPVSAMRGRWVIDGHFCGNLRAPWFQLRKQLPGESVFAG